MDQIQAFQLANSALQNFFSLNGLLSAIERIADKYRPVPLAIAFVLLTVGTMRGFLYPESKKFLQNIVRAAVLVCLVANLPALTDWTKQAVQAVADWPINEQVAVGNLTFNFTSGQRPVEETLENELASKVKGSSAAANASSQNQNPRGGAFGVIPGVGAVLDALNNAKNLAWQLLFGLYLLCLLLCKAIISLVSFVQHVIVILFSLYAPIAFGEWAIRSFRHRAQTFFLTFIGLLCWPIGTSFVNVVTLALFKALPSPADHNIGALIAAIVAAVPILLWMLIGHVLAPFYIQKMVVRGGAVLQGMLGGIGAGVGLGTAGVVGGALAGTGGFLAVASGAGLRGLTGQGKGQSGATEQGYSGTNLQPPHHSDFGDAAGASLDSVASPTARFGTRRAAYLNGGLIGGLRAAAHAAGQGMMLSGKGVERIGNFAVVAGEGVADAADPGISPSLGRRIVRSSGSGFAYARSYDSSSSDKARKYLD
jgi:hypothetical protein